MPEPEDTEIVIYARSDGGLGTVQSDIIDAMTLIESDLECDVTPDIITNLIDLLTNNNHVEFEPSSLVIAPDLHGSTGMFDNLMRLIKAPDSSLEHLVAVPGGGGEVSSLIESAVSAGVHVHVLGGRSGRVVSDSMSDVLDRRAGVGESWSGRPPIGFKVEEGHLVEGGDYGKIVAVLRLVQHGEVSKRSAADELGVSRRTIGRALDSPARYGLAD